MIVASMSFQIPKLRVSARDRSMFAPCVLPRGNCGVNKQTSAILSTLICGIIGSQRNSKVPAARYRG